ncbi:hypothetical protein FRACA_1820009 [Frankia canadensis]|uniref:Uncharacterized protein n=1 Tax=Frankia canadensis TaxID=1836972 RepID=A0A2I2KNS4_9ACTN|nr:hypothetical protein FRACA_1820009 [Frankia canadensis]SOU54617.1 hypothetical protein FRACA_1820009 [Frankia canadensis]
MPHHRRPRSIFTTTGEYRLARRRRGATPCAVDGFAVVLGGGARSTHAQGHKSQSTVCPTHRVSVPRSTMGDATDPLRRAT